MKYTKFFLWALLALTLCLPARAQDETPEPEEKRHWEVGIDLLPLINKETLPAASVFGRYHFTTRAGREMALRLRVGADVGLADTSLAPIFPGTTDSKQRNLGLFARPGIEWGKTVGKSTRIFVGSDLSLNYLRRFDSVDSDLIPPPRTLEYLYIDWSVGLHPFLGFRYNLLPSVSVSVESSANLFWLWGKWTFEGKAGVPRAPAGSSGEVYNGLRFRLDPISFLNFSYHF